MLFSLTLQHADKETTTKIVSELCEKFPRAGQAMNNDGTSRGDVEWLAFEQDMLRFSRLHPDYFFELQYQSLDPEDDPKPWLMVFRDGGVEDHFCLE